LGTTPTAVADLAAPSWRIRLLPVSGISRAAGAMGEGCAQHGNVKTDYILFICSGAFHSCKPSDMIAELQGRLPVRVKLQGLKQEELLRILTEPENNMIEQQVALMGVEGLTLRFTKDALQHVAEVAAELNRTVDNIGARRLTTVVESITNEISFTAADQVAQWKADHPEGGPAYE